jgi:hypothetical protein
MFNIFKSKELPFLEIEEALLLTANSIISAASSKHDLDAAMLGMGSVLPFVTEARRRFGIEPSADAVFARYLEVVKKEDFVQMAEETRIQGKFLSESQVEGAKASLIYMWYTVNIHQISSVRIKPN